MVYTAIHGKADVLCTCSHLDVSANLGCGLRMISDGQAWNSEGFPVTFDLYPSRLLRITGDGWLRQQVPARDTLPRIDDRQDPTTR